MCVTAFSALTMPFPNQELSPGPPWQRCGAPFENDGNGAYSASSAAVGQGVGSAVWLMIDCTSPGASLPFCGVLPSPNRLMTSAAIIHAATLRCLALADEAGDASVAFPALATGVGGFPLEECAAAMVGAVREYARAHPESAVRAVRFVVRSAEDEATFSRYAAAR